MRKVQSLKNYFTITSYGHIDLSIIYSFNKWLLNKRSFYLVSEEVLVHNSLGRDRRAFRKRSFPGSVHSAKLNTKVFPLSHFHLFIFQDLLKTMKQNEKQLLSFSWFLLIDKKLSHSYMISNLQNKTKDKKETRCS